MEYDKMQIPTPPNPSHYNIKNCRLKVIVKISESLTQLLVDATNNKAYNKHHGGGRITIKNSFWDEVSTYVYEVRHFWY